MKVKLAAVVAEIARTVDYSLLESEPKFTNLSRPHRMSLILACLAREDIARVEKLRKSAPAPTITTTIAAMIHSRPTGTARERLL